METIQLKGKKFGLFIPRARIHQAIGELALRMNRDLKGEKLLFIAVLNGSFMFAADLMRQLDMESELSFVKLSSYQGTASGGKVNKLIGLNTPVRDRTLIVLEDIVDTGNTLDTMYLELSKENPSSIRTSTLLFKPARYSRSLPPEYIALEVPDRFLVGYGLDYDGLGRNLPDIYSEL